MVKKRDYSKCFMCGSDKLWTGPKQALCLECRNPAGSFISGHQKNWKQLDYQTCPPNCCHHKGKKDYFSICGYCYFLKVPQIEDGIKNWKDWNWIIEKQKELENERQQR